MRARRRHKQNLSITRFRTTLLLRRRPHEPARLAKLHRVPPLPRPPPSEHYSLDRYFVLWNVIIVVVSCMCEIKTRLLKTSFYSLCTTYILSLSTTYKSMYQYVVKSGICSKTVHDLRHVYTSTSKHTIINTIMSAKFTNNTL